MPTWELDRIAAGCALAAVCAELCISANLLTVLGLPYVTDGGALPFKLHPGTDLLLAATLAGLAAGPAAWVNGLEPTLVMFFAAMAGCILSIALLTGPGNLIVLLDTFLPAGLLAAALGRMRQRTLGRLRLAMQLLLAANAVLALIERAMQATLIPLYLNDAAYRAAVADFRPTALFDHPLTGAMMMMMALALAPGSGRWRWPYQALAWAALVAFGGRMALGVTLLGVAAGAAHRIWRLLLARDGRLTWALLAAGLGAGGCAAVLVIALAAGLGDRLVAHMYWDQSAQVRLAQWQILGQMDVWQALFGVPREDLLRMLNALRLGTGVEVIENFSLLMFVSLGALGFPLFLAGLGALLAWCWGNTGDKGRALLFAAMFVASSSNSLGRKSTVLVCLVAAAACIPQKKGSGSFLKKRTEKLLSPRLHEGAVQFGKFSRWQNRDASARRRGNKSFLLLSFKKEGLSSLLFRQCA